MDEFMKMIYDNWLNTTDYKENVSWGNFGDALNKISDYLNENISYGIIEDLNREAWTIEENAFIKGFQYACTCLSNGKIEFNK